jgi:hypothetical protein
MDKIYALSEHVDELKAQKILADFYREYRTRTYGMLEMLAFAYEAGYSDGSTRPCLSPAALDQEEDNREKL